MRTSRTCESCQSLGKRSWSPAQHAASTQLSAAAGGWAAMGWMSSSEEVLHVPQGCWGTAAESRLFPGAFLTLGRGHFTQILGRGMGARWVCLGLMHFKSMHGLLCCTWELLFRSPTVPGTWVGTAQQRYQIHCAWAGLGQ